LEDLVLSTLNGVASKATSVQKLDVGKIHQIVSDKFEISIDFQYAADGSESGIS
jgi:hypothetical protein